MADLGKFWESFSDIGKWGRMVAMAGPVVWGLFQYEQSRTEAADRIALSVQSLADQFKSQVIMEDNRNDALATRITNLENHREADMHDAAVMAARIEGLKALEDQTLLGVTEMRDYLMQHHNVGGR